MVIRAACDDHPRKVPTRTRAMQRTGTVWGAARQVSSGHRPAEQLGRHIPAVGSIANWNSPPSQSFTLRCRSIAVRPGHPFAKIKKDAKFRPRKLLAQKADGVLFLLHPGRTTHLQ